LGVRGAGVALVSSLRDPTGAVSVGLMVAIDGTVRRWRSPVAAASGSDRVAEDVAGEGCGDGSEVKMDAETDA